MEKVKYPVGEQSFESLRRGGFLYVDKTRYIESIAEGSKYYFLGRPRRFGKSLFLSTIKCFFEAKRDLFRGLYIDSIGWDWQPYPVFSLDLNKLKYKNDSDLESLFEDFLSGYEQQYGIVRNVPNHSIRFSNLIKTVSEVAGRGVVILVDEYDKPLVNNIHDKERFDRYRDMLAEFYSNFKSSADYIRLVFLTGVSRFGKLSVFSGLNNISDISFDHRFSAICGITEDELRENFKYGIKGLAQEMGTDTDSQLARLKKWYDGYHFSPRCVDIYNPYSILNVMNTRSYRNYWIESGTPTLLLEQLKKEKSDLQSVMNARISQSGLSGLDIEHMNPASLLYQTGYLTIKDYNPVADIYRLGIPNEEVLQGFFEYILPYYANLHKEDPRAVIFDMAEDINNGCIDSFMKRLESMFGGLSYDMDISRESDVRNIMVIVFRLIGMFAEVEYRTSDGRIDILIRTEHFVYIIELKFNGSAEEALEQIESKKYALPWSTDKRQVVGIGINYSSEKRRIDGWRSKWLSK